MVFPASMSLRFGNHSILSSLNALCDKEGHTGDPDTPGCMKTQWQRPRPAAQQREDLDDP